MRISKAYHTQNGMTTVFDKEKMTDLPMKFHTKIELIDEATNNVDEILEFENMIHPYWYKQMYKHFLMTLNRPSNAGVPAAFGATNPFHRLVVTDNRATESENEILIKGKYLGYADKFTSYSGDDKYKGSYTKLSTFYGENTHKLVYDFASHACNGQIGSIYWASQNCFNSGIVPDGMEPYKANDTAPIVTEKYGMYNENEKITTTGVPPLVYGGADIIHSNYVQTLKELNPKIESATVNNVLQDERRVYIILNIQGYNDGTCPQYNLLIYNKLKKTIEFDMLKDYCEGTNSEKCLKMRARSLEIINGDKYIALNPVWRPLKETYIQKMIAKYKAEKDVNNSKKIIVYETGGYVTICEIHDTNAQYKYFLDGNNVKCTSNNTTTYASFRKTGDANNRDTDGWQWDSGSISAGTDANILLNSKDTILYSEVPIFVDDSFTNVFLEMNTFKPHPTFTTIMPLMLIKKDGETIEIQEEPINTDRQFVNLGAHQAYINNTVLSAADVRNSTTECVEYDFATNKIISRKDLTHVYSYHPWFRVGNYYTMYNNKLLIPVNSVNDIDFGGKPIYNKSNTRFMPFMMNGHTIIHPNKPHFRNVYDHYYYDGSRYGVGSTWTEDIRLCYGYEYPVPYTTHNRLPKVIVKNPTQLLRITYVFTWEDMYTVNMRNTTEFEPTTQN